MMRRVVRVLTFMSVLVLATVVVSGAQTAPVPQTQAAKLPNARRLELEQQLRQRTGQVVRQRLNLNDEQMSKLQSTNRQFEQQRADLLRREREARQALRAQLMSGDTANQAKVSQLLDEQLQLQRQRIDLVQNEQRELGKFLTPVQRAKYLGLQNEIRRRAQALRAGQGANTQLNRQVKGQANDPMAPVRRQPKGGLKQ
jgi:Spy/CpxP family protein refolding chaperone